MTNSIRVAFETLGCKLNQYETDSIAATLRRRGYSIVEWRERADIRIVNTCTVTNRADRKSRNAVAKARKNSPTVIATGCFVDSRRGKQIPEIEIDASYYVDNLRKSRIPDIVDAYARGEIIDPDAFSGNLFAFETPDRTFHTRTNIKIQDGCDNFCTFCIIPRVRGRAQSRPVADVLADIKRAVDAGSNEIVLTGVNMSRYDAAGEPFESLLEKVVGLPGDFRVRISSLEPDTLSDSFADLFSSPRMMPHLHLCLQSGSDTILRAMRRMYTTTQFRRVVENLRKLHPLFNVTTDVIVGFPGETDNDFARTLALVEEIGFGHVHTFPYSAREGTAAVRMGPIVPGTTRKARAAKVRHLAARVKVDYRSRLIGTTQRVLVERVRQHNGAWYAEGFGENYVPVKFAVTESAPTNTIYPVDTTCLESHSDDPRLFGVVTRHE